MTPETPGSSTPIGPDGHVAAQQPGLHLCGNCWSISHPNGWWGWNDVEGVPTDATGDPSFYRCPCCGFDHRDDDADPGVWDGTRDELERIRRDEQPELRSVREALAVLSGEISKLSLAVEEDLPMDVRDELLRLGGSLNDFVFQVYKQRQQDDGEDPKGWMFRALEIESGGGAWGVTAREALDNYFRDDLLDHRSVPDV